VPSLVSPSAQGGLATDGGDLLRVVGQGLEGAVKNELENKNASTGFWGGAIGAAGGLFAFSPLAGAGQLTNDAYAFEDDLAKGVAGGLGSMTKAGKGFGPGFWGGVAGAAGPQLVKFKSNAWLTPVLSAAQAGLVGGMKSRMGGKLFNAGFYTGVASSGIDDLVKSFGTEIPSVSASSPAGSGYALVQPKTSTNKKGVTTTTIPLSKVNGATWANAAPWAQLY
jgi:hypothetical protein